MPAAKHFLHILKFSPRGSLGSGGIVILVPILQIRVPNFREAEGLSLGHILVSGMSRLRQPMFFLCIRGVSWHALLEYFGDLS